MTLLQRLAFALKHDFDREYIIIDPESPNHSVRCTTYEKALEVRAEFAKKKPWYGMAKIMVGVTKI